MGRRALNEDSEATAEAFAELSQAQQVLFRIGLVDAMRQATRRAKPGTDVSKPFQEQRVVELMSVAIPRSRGQNQVFSDRPARFGEYVSRQGRMQQTKNIALGGSPTARNVQDDAREAVNTMTNVWDQIRQSPSISRMVLDSIGALGQRYLGFRDDVAAIMARRLMTMTPQAQIRYLESLERRVGPDPLAGFAQGMRELAATVSREGGRTIGRNVAIEENDG